MLRTNFFEQVNFGFEGWCLGQNLLILSFFVIRTDGENKEIFSWSILVARADVMHKHRWILAILVFGADDDQFFSNWSILTVKTDSNKKTDWFLLIFVMTADATYKNSYYCEFWLWELVLKTIFLNYSVLVVRADARDDF